MIHNASDLSADEKSLLEGLLGHSIADDSSIAIHTFSPASAPDWLQAAWDSAKRSGADRLSSEEIEAEIAAARKQRRELGHSPELRHAPKPSKEQ